MNQTTLDLGSLVTVRTRQGAVMGHGAVVGFDHEHQFVCVQFFESCDDPRKAPRTMELDADRMTLGWQRK